LAAFVSRRAGARLVLTRHVLFPMSGIHRLTLRRTARVIAVSQAVADGLRKQEIFAPDTIALIHNGIDVDRFAGAAGGREAAGQKESPGKRLRVGMVGHLAPIKGQEDFIRAAAIVCGGHDDVEFIMVGEDKSQSGKHRQGIERLIAELDLNQRVRLSGWVDDTAELLPTFDLFVSPARSEPFGLAIVEAMAAGTPVIATMSEGAREIIDDKHTGRLVPIGDVRTLAKVICELLSDPAQRGRLSVNAQLVVRERFSLERMVVETEKVYEQILGRS
jgi:glycosyltransferase involved in cell wall biosynthesis